MRVLKKIAVVVQKDKSGNVILDSNGKEVTKRYTNFELEFEISGQLKTVPIQPVNFGEQQNRRNYQVLSLISVLKEESPF